MNKETFNKSIESWMDFYRSPGVFLKNSKEGDFNTTQRLRRLYTIAREEFAPILYAAGEMIEPDFSSNSIVFDFPAASLNDHENFTREINKHKELGLPEPHFIDLNYLKGGKESVIGFRLFDKGDNVIWVKVINCPDFYLMDNGEIYYGVKNIMDKNEMNILRSRVGDYFLNRTLNSPQKLFLG